MLEEKIESKIVGYHKDEDDHWVAELDCGHNQHVRHNPPMESRPWVVSEDGRKKFLGYPLRCLLCEERENGTAGKILNLFAGKVQWFHGKNPTDKTAKNATSGNWIDVQTGDDVSVKDRVWESAIGKQPVEGSAYITKLGIRGDQQADQKNHGGIDKAVCLYPSEHYPLWEEIIGTSLCPSAFGENIQSEGLLEKAVCVGDQFSIGSVLLEVSQPRQPCWKIATRWGFPTLAKEFLKQAKTGWYFRVLKEGNISAEDFLVLEKRPLPDWTVERVVRARFDKTSKSGEREKLKTLIPLAESWKR